jgi:integrase
VLLKKHRSRQAELKLANRSHYHDHGLVFATEWDDLPHHGDTLGQPINMSNLASGSFAKLLKASGVRPIKFHGLRHTCATLLLQANVPIKVVSERLGHMKIQITLDIYAHALPSMQQEAAVKMGTILYG